MPPQPPVAPQLTEVLFKNLKGRAIGPAVMGGRVSEIALDPRNPALFYVGMATGGIFKSADNGISFEPIFDKETTLSIGAISIAPSDSDVLWVGTGEPSDRNSAGWGNGVYRSTDGGGTWQNVGLKDSRTIGRIAVHPKDPNVAYVAASGHLWVDGGERGLFKTTDAGKSWKPVLQAAGPNAARTGCPDVVMDPSNPEILYATLYARQRTPWGFSYGVSASNGEDVGGIFKSTNGGGTWKKLGGGLPGQTGRIGLAISASNPKIVMAVVQSDEGGASDIRDIHSRAGGVFRSEDGGEKWTRVSDINPRPFYFSEIKIDPSNDQRVYVLGFAVLDVRRRRTHLPRRSFGEGASRLPCDRHSTEQRSAAQAAKTGGQEQAAEAAGLPAGVVRHRRRRLPKLLRREDMGPSRDLPDRAVLPHLR